MSTVDPVVAAAQKAEQAAAQAAQAARNAADAKELEFLDSCTHIKQISEGRTSRDATRLKSRYVSVLGLDRWSRLCADSR